MILWKDFFFKVTQDFLMCWIFYWISWNRLAFHFFTCANLITKTVLKLWSPKFMKSKLGDRGAGIMNFETAELSWGIGE